VSQSTHTLHPRVFCTKSAQTIENKGSRRDKLLQESLRVRNLLRHRGLTVLVFESVTSESGREKGIGTGLTGRKGLTWAGGYFMGYYIIWLALVKRNFGSILGIGGNRHHRAPSSSDTSRPRADSGLAPLSDDLPETIRNKIALFSSQEIKLLSGKFHVDCSSTRSYQGSAR
jgi:hypothetical protein